MDKGLAALKATAQEKPLAHPTAFELRHMNYAYAPPSHLVEIDQAVYEGLNPDTYPNRLRNIVRLLPREHGKSEDVSHKIPSWLALRDPNIRILIMMESEDQAAGKLAQCSETIKRLAPRYDRHIEVDAYKKFKLAREATYDVPTIKAAGFETSVTGGHYDLIVFDDLISQESSATEARRDKNWNRLQERLNLGSEGETVKLVVGTRKHPEDIYDKLLNSGGWDVEVRKAISDFSVVENGEYDVITSDGEQFAANDKPHDADIARVVPHRDVPVLWPERWPLSKLIHKYLEGSIDADDGEDEDLSGSRVWIRENQNRADALMGQVLDRGMLHFVSDPFGDQSRDLNDLPCYAGLDLALEQDAEKAATNDTDYFALAVASYDAREGVFYIRELERKRGMSMKEAIDWVERIMGRFPTRQLYIESNQAQRFFTQTAQETKLFAKEVQSTGKKEDRIITMSSRFENGKAVICGNPQSPKWDSFISEWTQFPGGDHDDRLDALQVCLGAKHQQDEEAVNTVRKPFI